MLINSLRKAVDLVRRSVVISLCLLMFSLDISYAASTKTIAGEQDTLSHGLQEFSIPSEIGTIAEFHQGKNGKTIIYIQDAHDSLEAQVNIAKIIVCLVENYGVKTVFEESYEGPVPTDPFFSFFKDNRAKEKVSYFLMDKLRLGGAEYAHINRTKDFNLIGADSLKLHKENIEWFKKSAEMRSSLEQDLEVIHNEIRVLANQRFPKELKVWMKLKDRLDHNQMSLLDYLKRIRKGDLKAYPSIEFLIRAESTHDEKNINAKTLFLEIDRFENDYANRYLANQSDRKIYRIHKALNLLKRLNRIEVTSEEFNLVQEALLILDTKKITEFLFRETGRPFIFSNLWEQQIRDAVRFYETAQARDRRLEKVLNNHKIKVEEPLAVLVYGGFHKNRIKSFLNEKDYSYVIITPKITQMSDVHRTYYRQLMGGGYHSFEMPFFMTKAAPPMRVFEMFDLSAKRFLNYITGSEVSRDVFVHDALVTARSEIRNREDVVASLKTMSLSGIEDWDQLLRLMESYPQYFDRIYLDLDETIFTSKVYLGSHQWHVDEAKYFESGKWRLGAKKGRIEKELLRRGLLRLVEPRMLEVLRDMKRRNPKLIIQGLTSRRGFMEESTRQILKSLGWGDLEVKYDAFQSRKLAAIQSDLAADERTERGITLFIDDEADGFSKHKLMKEIEAMGSVVISNRKVSKFDMDTSLTLFRHGMADGANADGEPRPEDHLISALLLSRFSEDAARRSAVYLDPDIQRFVSSGPDKVKMAYIEAGADFFSRSFEKHLFDADRDKLLDFYYGLVSFDKELWKEAHREGKLPYQIIDRNLPFLHGRGNYELLLTPKNAYFFMEPLLDYLVAKKPDVVLLPDTAARPFTESLNYFIEKEGLSTRVINFPISTGDARDTRYELTRWMRLMRGEIPVTNETDKKLVAFLAESGIEGIHSGDNAVIFDDGITRGHAVSMITHVVEDAFAASVQGAFVAFDYRNNIDKRRFSAFSAFRIYGDFKARDTNYHSAPGMIVRLDWEFDSEFKGVGSRKPYFPPPPKFRGEGGGGEVLAAFKDHYERFFHRSRREHRLPDSAGEPHLTDRQSLTLNKADTSDLPDEIRGYVTNVFGPGSLTRDKLIEKLEKLAAEPQGGELVKLLRTQAGLILTELGSETAVSLIERGKRKLTDRSLNRILTGLKTAYEKDGRLSAEEVEHYVRRGFGLTRPESAALPARSKESAASKPDDEEGLLSLIRVRNEVPLWAFEDKTIRPRDRRLLGEKNVFFYRFVRGNEDLGFVILAVLKNKAGEKSLIIEKIQPRIIHDQDVQAEAVRDLIVRYLSENNKTIRALYTDTKIGFMAGVSESHRIRRGLSSGYFKLVPQTTDLLHEGTTGYYKDRPAGDVGLIWRRFDSDEQKRFDSASQFLEAIRDEKTWGAALIKGAFEVDIRRYTAYRRMHLTFDKADLLVLEEIVRILGERQGQLSEHTFVDAKAEEEARFKIRARMELVKYQTLGIKPEFKKLYTNGGTIVQRQAKQALAIKFLLGNFWDGSHDLVGMKWSEIQKRFAQWGAEDLLDRIAGGRKGRLLEHLIPGAYSRSGRAFSLREDYRLSTLDFQRYLNGEWYAAPAGSEYTVRGDEHSPLHWNGAINFFNSLKGHEIQFEVVDDLGLVGHDISESNIIEGEFFFRDGKTHYTSRRANLNRLEGSVITPSDGSQQVLRRIDLKMFVLQNARDLMGSDVAAQIVQVVNDAIDRHPQISSNPRQVLSDFTGFVDEASYLSRVSDIKRFFASLVPQSDGFLKRSEVRAAKVDEVKRLVMSREGIQNLQKKYVVPVDMDIFEALEPEQQEEFYKAAKMYSENASVNFVFMVDVTGDRPMTRVWSTVNALAKKYGNIKIKTLSNAKRDMSFLEPSEIQGRTVLGIAKEGERAIRAERLKKEVADSEELFWLKYLLNSKEAGLLMSAIQLLDSGQDDLLRLKDAFTVQDIPLSLRSEIRTILRTYEYIGQSA